MTTSLSALARDVLGTRDANQAYKIRVRQLATGSDLITRIFASSQAEAEKRALERARQSYRISPDKMRELEGKGIAVFRIVTSELDPDQSRPSFDSLSTLACDTLMKDAGPPTAYENLGEVNGLRMYRKRSSGQYSIWLNPHQKLADFPNEKMAREFAESYKRRNSGDSLSALARDALSPTEETETDKGPAPRSVPADDSLTDLIERARGGLREQTGDTEKDDRIRELKEEELRIQRMSIGSSGDERKNFEQKLMSIGRQIEALRR